MLRRGERRWFCENVENAAEIVFEARVLAPRCDSALGGGGALHSAGDMGGTVRAAWAGWTACPVMILGTCWQAACARPPAAWALGTWDAWMLLAAWAALVDARGVGRLHPCARDVL